MDSDVKPLKFLHISLIILCCFTDKIKTDVGGVSPDNALLQYPLVFGPQVNFPGSIFVTTNNSRVVAQLGGEAILPCTVRINTPDTMTWIRMSDFQVLTLGLSTHTVDERLLVAHSRHNGFWTLRIGLIRWDDQGQYECQMASYPKQSIYIYLTVVQAYSRITGSSELHIDEGSSLRLECKLRMTTENPEYLFWYHNDKMVNYDDFGEFAVSFIFTEEPPAHNHYKYHRRHKGNMRHNYKVRTRRSPSRFNITKTESQLLVTPVVSILTVSKVKLKHAGNYTCSPSNTRPSSILVHVHKGEKSAAMQHANGTDGYKSTGTKILQSKPQWWSHPQPQSSPFYNIIFMITFLNFHTILPILIGVLSLLDVIINH